MKVALGAAVAVTGASALIYILMRSRKRHPDPGKQDISTANHSENVSSNKASSDVKANPRTDKSNALCSDMPSESKDKEDTSLNNYPYVNFNGHVPINGKNSEEILDDHMTDHNEINVSVKENHMVDEHTEICGENITEVEVEQSTADTSRDYPKTSESIISLFDKAVSVVGLSDNFERSNCTVGKTEEETGMEFVSGVPTESSDSIFEKAGLTMPSVAQNFNENENISMNMNFKEDIISSITVPEMLSSKPEPMEMGEMTRMSRKITEDEGCSSLNLPHEKEASSCSFLEYDIHATTVLAKEEKEPMRGSSVNSVSLEKSAQSISGVNEESNVMSDTEQKHELTPSMKVQGKEPPVSPSLGKDEALTDLSGFALEEDSSVSFTIDRDQESVNFPSLDLNKEYKCSPDLSQIDSLGSSLLVQDEKSNDSLVMCKEEQSFLSSSLEHEKHSTLSSSLEEEKQSTLSSNLEQEEQSTHSSTSCGLDQERATPLPEERSHLSNLDKEEHFTISSNLDQEEQFNLPSSMASAEHTTLQCRSDHEKQCAVSSTLDQVKQSTLSTILVQEEGSMLSSSKDQEEKSTVLSNSDQEEHPISSTSLEQQSSPLSNFDQEECCNRSSSTAIAEETTGSCRMDHEKQSTLSFCMEQKESPLSLSLTPDEGSSLLLDQEDQLTHSSNLDQGELNLSQEKGSISLAQEEGSTYSNEEEGFTLSLSVSQKEQTSASSVLDEQSKPARSCAIGQEEQLDVSPSLGNEKQITVSPILAQKEQSDVPPNLVTEEQFTLTTGLDLDQESNVMPKESEKLCPQAQETSKDFCTKSTKAGKENCQKNTVLQKEKEIESTSSKYLAMEIVTISSKKGDTEHQQKTSNQEEEKKMPDRTENANKEISTLRESSGIGTSGSTEVCSTTTEMLRDISSTGTSKLRGICNAESSKERESDCSTGIDNLKESSSTGIGNLEENITVTHKLKESDNAETSKLRESSDAGPSKVRGGSITGTSNIKESSTLKKAAESDKGTVRKEQSQDNQGDSAAADLEHDAASEHENINSDSMSLKSMDSSNDGSEVEPETMFNPSTFPVLSQEQYIFYEFEIPLTLVGRLIGRKGAFVNKVKAATDATVIVYPHNNRRLKLCCVEGTKQQVRAALDMIREHFPQNRYPDVTLVQVSTQQSVVTPAQPTLNNQAMQIELTAGVVVEVRVSSVVSAGELWVQQPLHPSYSALHRLQSCMNLNYGDGSNTPPLPCPVQDGTVCVAQIKKHWLRCQVHSTQNNVSLVVLLDVGGTVSLATSLLRQIRYDYMTLPFQATQCFLHGIQPAKDDVWDDASVAVMEEFVSDSILFATVVSYTEDGVPLVSLYRRDQDQYVHLNEKLVLLGHARWVSPQPAS